MTTPTAFEAARQHFLDGVAAFESGRFETAEQAFLASLAQVPGRPSVLINLAATQVNLGKAEAALATADALLADDPDCLDARIHQAAALSLLERDAEAIAVYDEVLAAIPELAEGWVRQAESLHRLERHAEAVTALDRGLALHADEPDAWSLRGALMQALGRMEDAATAWRTAIAHGADPVVHDYYLAAIGERAAPSAAPSSYLRALFDDYAPQFDQHLVRTLRYRGHERLVASLPDPIGPTYRSALDLGCGTGLCGPLLRPRVARLAGVDLAPRMLDAARGRGVYDTLIEAEAVAYLASLADAHDLIVAADVLIYIGALDPLVEALGTALVPGGVFAFTAETFDGSTPGPAGGFGLLPDRRYAHAADYLRRQAERGGFVVERLDPFVVREEDSRPVPGLLGVWRRQGDRTI